MKGLGCCLTGAYNLSAGHQNFRQGACTGELLQGMIILLPFLREGNKLSLYKSQIIFIDLALVVTMVIMLVIPSTSQPYLLLVFPCVMMNMYVCSAVLPKFEVTITPPSFVAYTDRSNITATVCARQVYFNPHRNKYVKSMLFAYCKHTNSVLTHMAVHLQYTVNLLHTNKCYHDSILQMYFHKLTPQKYNSSILLLCYSRLHT